MTVGRVARRALPLFVLSLGACLGEPTLVGRMGAPAANHADAVSSTIVERSFDGVVVVDPHLIDACDLDLDGWESTSCGGDDCDDRAAEVNPAILENEDWTVDVLAEDASLPALAIDARGVAHAAYRAGSGADASIVYATNISGTWLPETVDTIGETVHPPSLGIAPNGRAHLCWTSFDEGTTRLVYATNARGAWRVEVDEWHGGAPTRCALAVDARGAVHLAYQDPLVDMLRYETNVLGRWQAEIVDGAPGTGTMPTLLLDGDYLPRIGYQDGDRDLHWAVRSGRVWQSEIVEGDLGGNGPFVAAFSLDEQGAAHVSYRAAEERQLRYATNATGVWVYETIEMPGYSARTSAIGIDGDAYAHIVFSRDDRQDQPEDLLFATRAGGAWTQQTIDEEGRTGWGPSLLIGPTLLQVTYFRFVVGGQTDVLYATRSIPDGIDADCDGEW